jgi:hypothetical protein
MRKKKEELSLPVPVIMHRALPIAVTPLKLGEPSLCLPLHQNLKLKVSKGLVVAGLTLCLLEQLSMMQLQKHVSIRKSTTQYSSMRLTTKKLLRDKEDWLLKF